MADGDHHRARASVQDVGDTAREGLRRRLVEGLPHDLVHCPLLSV
jgi:hypothetical protein